MSPPLDPDRSPVEVSAQVPCLFVHGFATFNRNNYSGLSNTRTPCRDANERITFDSHPYAK